FGVRWSKEQARYEALHKAADDVAKFNENRCGEMPNSALAVMGREAEAIVRWHAQAENAKRTVEGVSRLWPPGAPSSQEADRKHVTRTGVGRHRHSSPTVARGTAAVPRQDR